MVTKRENTKKLVGFMVLNLEDITFINNLIFKKTK